MNSTKIVFDCRLKTLTPVHVGSGKNYLRNADFEIFQNLLTVYDSHRLQKKIEQADPSIKDAYFKELQTEGPSLYKFFRRVGWQSNEFVRYRLPVDSININEIKSQLRSGLGVPLIPGSSIKGALRTALWGYLLEQAPDARQIDRLLPQSREVRDKYAAQKVEKYLFGDHPQNDWLRALQVEDAAFEKEELALFQVKILTRTRQGYAFKLLGKERKNLSRERARQATSIVLEALGADALSQTTRVVLDRFLLEHEKFKPTPFSLPSADEFWPRVHAHFLKLAEGEKDFFEEMEFREVKRFYERSILERKFAENEYLVRLSWGGGWRFMTGDWLTPAQKEMVRRIYNLGKGEAEDFPKTRRLVVQNDLPSVPPGWATITVKAVRAV
ncbi:CRISPR-associated RAMP protein, Csm5 family [Caldithrix abyssi DSM 13497]|uniref:CRISPR system Cms protein Csm5 n=1 Tax=Caldithrix abyssi DSM 13497 TaxID=880073 RepID=H1XX17_CALAY|nr:type III-A CRISPR-associated RAMP protein Csm5 [Caldithrix abyssi]APF19577.1 CRISPR type III-A/MTUBE-associated RAMP protein Csm5 [Caldithrix abyssi DSM 13497]EHO39704.1 CRISPR-associated RAMP protein, Csm5 family [Caldithrix abyssi DSM 13497]